MRPQADPPKISIKVWLLLLPLSSSHRSRLPCLRWAVRRATNPLLCVRVSHSCRSCLSCFPATSPQSIAHQLPNQLGTSAGLSTLHVSHYLLRCRHDWLLGLCLFNHLRSVSDCAVHVKVHVWVCCVSGYLWVEHNDEAKGLKERARGPKWRRGSAAESARGPRTDES